MARSLEPEFPEFSCTAVHSILNPPMRTLPAPGDKAKLLDKARQFFDQAELRAGEGDLKQAAELIVRGLHCEHRAARLGPQVLRLIKSS